LSRDPGDPRTDAGVERKPADGAVDLAKRPEIDLPGSFGISERAQSQLENMTIVAVDQAVERVAIAVLSSLNERALVVRTAGRTPCERPVTEHTGCFSGSIRGPYVSHFRPGSFVRSREGQTQPPR